MFKRLSIFILIYTSVLYGSHVFAQYACTSTEYCSGVDTFNVPTSCSYLPGPELCIQGYTTAQASCDSSCEYSFCMDPLGGICYQGVPVICNSSHATNGSCSVSNYFETSGTCCVNASEDPECGNGTCETGETNANCPTDCTTTGGDNEPNCGAQCSGGANEACVGGTTCSPAPWHCTAGDASSGSCVGPDSPCGDGGICYLACWGAMCGGPTTDTCDEVEVYEGTPKGYMDTYDPVECRIFGWAGDFNTPDSPTLVELREGSRWEQPPIGDAVTIYSGLADLPRESAVCSAIGGSNCGVCPADQPQCKHGWGFPLPESFRDGQPHQLWALAYNSSDTCGNTKLLDNSGLTVICSPPPTVPMSCSVPSIVPTSVSNLSTPITVTVGGISSSVNTVFMDAWDDALGQTDGVLTLAATPSNGQATFTFTPSLNLATDDGTSASIHISARVASDNNPSTPADDVSCGAVSDVTVNVSIPTAVIDTNGAGGGYGPRLYPDVPPNGTVSFTAIANDTGANLTKVDIYYREAGPTPGDWTQINSGASCGSGVCQFEVSGWRPTDAAGKTFELAVLAQDSNFPASVGWCSGNRTPPIDWNRCNIDFDYAAYTFETTPQPTSTDWITSLSGDVYATKNIINNPKSIDYSLPSTPINFKPLFLDETGNSTAFTMNNGFVFTGTGLDVGGDVKVNQSPVSYIKDLGITPTFWPDKFSIPSLMTTINDLSSPDKSVINSSTLDKLSDIDTTKVYYRNGSLTLDMTGYGFANSTNKVTVFYINGDLTFNKPFITTSSTETKRVLFVVAGNVLIKGPVFSPFLGFGPTTRPAIEAAIISNGYIKLEDQYPSDTSSQKDLPIMVEGPLVSKVGVDVARGLLGEDASKVPTLAVKYNPVYMTSLASDKFLSFKDIQWFNLE